MTKVKANLGGRPQLPDTWRFLSALGCWDEHLQGRVESSKCLWDKGSHCLSISEDLLSRIFRKFLSHPVRNPYWRCHVHAISYKWMPRSASQNRRRRYSLFLWCYPYQRTPNRKSGVILGQQALMEVMVARCIPRYLLIAKREQVDDHGSGDI